MTDLSITDLIPAETLLQWRSELSISKQRQIEGRLIDLKVLLEVRQWLVDNEQDVEAEYRLPKGWLYSEIAREIGKATSTLQGDLTNLGNHTNENLISWISKGVTWYHFKLVRWCVNQRRTKYTDEVILLNLISDGNEFGEIPTADEVIALAIEAGGVKEHIVYGIVRQLEGWLSQLPAKLNLSRDDSRILLAKVADIREFLESRI